MGLIADQLKRLGVRGREVRDQCLPLVAPRSVHARLVDGLSHVRLALERFVPGGLHKYECLGFSIVKKTPRSTNSDAASATNLAMELAASTFKFEIPERFGKPSGCWVERSCGGSGAPALTKCLGILLSRARVNVPQGGAK